MIRVLLILLLFWQPLTFRAAGVPREVLQAHEDASCCAVVVTTNCCGETVEQMFCPMSDGPCQCSSRSIPARHSLPEAPLPTPSERDSVSAVPASPVMVIAATNDNVGTCLCAAQGFNLQSQHTHNEVQALLGVWRT